MASQRKPSIVFVHGLWADGSCFAKLIPTLQKEGFEVIASQHGLDSHAGDVTCFRDCFVEQDLDQQSQAWTERLGRPVHRGQTGFLFG